MMIIIIIISNKRDLYFTYFYQNCQTIMNEDYRTPFITIFWFLKLAAYRCLTIMYVGINEKSYALKGVVDVGGCVILYKISMVKTINILPSLTISSKTFEGFLLLLIQIKSK